MELTINAPTSLSSLNCPPSLHCLNGDESQRSSETDILYTGDLTRIENREENLEELPRRSNWKLPDTEGNENCLVIFIHAFLHTFI